MANQPQYTIQYINSSEKHLYIWKFGTELYDYTYTDRAADVTVFNTKSETIEMFLYARQKIVSGSAKQNLKIYNHDVQLSLIELEMCDTVMHLHSI